MKTKYFLNQRVDNVSFSETYDLIIDSVNKKEKSPFFVLNAFISRAFNQDKSLSASVNKKAKVIFCEGVPLIKVLTLFGIKLKERVSGTDLVEKVLKNKKFKVFLLGANNEILNKLKIKYSTSVCGCYSPNFFNGFSTKELNKTKKIIDKSNPDVILVALGVPKQEKWIIDNYQKVKGNVFIGVGSALEILAGDKQRAPLSMQRNGFEWLWRIYLEPFRLIPRYVLDFLYLVRLSVYSLKAARE